MITTQEQEDRDHQTDNSRFDGFDRGDRLTEEARLSADNEEILAQLRSETHTPGPWYWAGQTLRNNEREILSAAALGEGDRNLISMAPKLLFALSLAVRRLEEVNEECGDGDATFAAHYGREAINEALGVTCGDDPIQQALLAIGATR